MLGCYEREGEGIRKSRRREIKLGKGRRKETGDRLGRKKDDGGLPLLSKGLCNNRVSVGDIFSPMAQIGGTLPLSPYIGGPAAVYYAQWCQCSIFWASLGV